MYLIQSPYYIELFPILNCILDENDDRSDKDQTHKRSISGKIAIYVFFSFQTLAKFPGSDYNKMKLRVAVSA